MESESKVNSAKVKQELKSGDGKNVYGQKSGDQE